MRPFTALLIVLVIIAAFLFYFRYEITVNSPLLVKLDRWTGQTWVANNGVWMAISHQTAKLSNLTKEGTRVETPLE